MRSKNRSGRSRKNSGIGGAEVIAGMVLSTEVLITDFNDEKDQKSAAIII